VGSVWSVLVVVLCAGVVVAFVLQVAVQSTDGDGGRARYRDMTSLAELGRSVERFRAEKHRLPARLQELAAFEPDGPVASSAVLIDRWGRPFVYTVLAPDRYELRFLGADGAPGGEGDDADLVWERQGGAAPTTGPR
jgi:hypothetical protein